MHGNIKPGKIMLGGHDKKQIKLIGFSVKQSSNGYETNAGVSPRFIAPELIDPKQFKLVAPELFKKAYNKQCDIWSLGVTLYFLLSGEWPFNGTTKLEIFEKIKSGKYDMPKTFSKELKDLISKMLEINPKKRISAKDILNHTWIKEAQDLGGSIRKCAGKDDESNKKIIESISKHYSNYVVKELALSLLI